MLLVFNKDDFQYRIFFLSSDSIKELSQRYTLSYYMSGTGPISIITIFIIFCWFCFVIQSQTIQGWSTVCALYQFVVQPFVACFLFQYCLTYSGLMVTLHFVGSYFLSVAGTSIFQSDKSLFDAHRSSILISNYLFIQRIDSSIAN